MLCLILLWEQAAKINTLYLFTSKFFQEELKYRWCGLFFLNLQLLVLEASWPEESPPSPHRRDLLALKLTQWMLQGWAASAISHPCNFPLASPAGYSTAKTHLTGLSPKVWGGKCKELCPWCLQKGFPAPPVQPWDWDSAAELLSQPGNWTIQGRSALQWATCRCQITYSRQNWGRKAAVAPGDDSKPATVTMGVGSRWVQWLKTSTCCAQKAKLEGEVRSQLRQNGPFPSTWKAPNSCGEEENSQDLWQGRARHTHKVSCWAEEALTGWQCWRAWGQQAGQLTASFLRNHDWGKPSRYLTKLAWPEDSQETKTALRFVGSEKDRTGPRGWQWGDLPANPHSTTWQLWGCWWPDKRLSRNL